jgi:hypothetical protein
MKCPYCDAEVSSDDLFCGECGKRLPTTPATRRGMATPLIIGLVAVVVVGCIFVAAVGGIIIGRGLPILPQASPTSTLPPTPTLVSTPTPIPSPTVNWLTYQSDELGISMQYPQEWFMEEDSLSRTVIFAENEDDLEMGDFLTGTSFAAASGSIEELGMASARETLQFITGFLSEEYTDIEIGEIEPYRIDNEDGALMTVEGEFDREGVQLKAWIAVAVVNDYVYMLLAGAPVEDWEEQGAVLQAMLDSVQLSEPEIVTPSPVPPTTPTPVPLTPSPVAGVDPYEPDDSIAEAKPITGDGTPQDHNFHLEGDHDYVSFAAEEGISYIIETMNLGGDIDTIIYLYDGEGNELFSDDDGAEEPLASRLIWIAPSSGTYYVMITDLGEDSAGADATYSIAVTAGAVIEGDEYEPDNTISQANPIDTDGSPQTHTFHASGDMDYVYFAAQEDVEYVIQTGNLQSGCDTRIYLYDEDGEELDYDDDAADEAFASRIVWTASSSGTYYVEIDDYSGQAGPEVSYEIWISSSESAE